MYTRNISARKERKELHRDWMQPGQDWSVGCILRRVCRTSWGFRQWCGPNEEGDMGRKNRMCKKRSGFSWGWLYIENYRGLVRYPMRQGLRFDVLWQIVIQQFSLDPPDVGLTEILLVIIGCALVPVLRGIHPFHDGTGVSTVVLTCFR